MAEVLVLASKMELTSVDLISVDVRCFTQGVLFEHYPTAFWSVLDFIADMR
jgi:hypothetical protein